MLVIGIIFLILGICGIIGALIVSKFSFNSGKIVKFNNIHKKFERNYLLENFIGAYSGTSGFILMFIGFLFVSNSFMPTPKAIDVYRGKTELEITSVNGVPKDTVVLWKNVITE